MRNTISVECVGSQLGCNTIELTKRHLMSYAAVLNATEAHYMDDAYTTGIVGVPTFIVSPEWQVINHDICRQVLGLTCEQMWSCIHVAQDSTFYQVLRPGMSITTKGMIAQVKPTSIGAYIAIRLVTSETHSGSMVAESWFCGIVLHYPATGNAKTAITPPVLEKWDGRSDGILTAPLVDVSRVLPHLYTEAADIWNPIHTEKQAALDAGLDDILLHGTCTWGLAGHFLIARCASGKPEKLVRLAGRMANKASVGSRLSIQFQPPSLAGGSGALDMVRFQVVDQDNHPVITDGAAYFHR